MKLENKKFKLDQNTLLLVENSNACAFLIKEVLGKTMNVIIVQNGALALNVLKSEKIDIVLLDIMLPDISGFNLCKEIKKIKPSTPVIATTAYNRFSKENKSQKNIFDKYMLKPLNIRELTDTINDYLRQCNATTLINTPI